MDHLREVGDYWDQRSHGFSDAINEEADSYVAGEWKERFRKLLGDAPLDILDDGAGAGFFSMILAELGHRVTSIDYSEKMVERIVDNMAKRGYKADAKKMDAQALEFADESFDAVVQRNVLWNLDRPGDAIAEIYRVLRPGGVFILQDGNHYLSAHDEEFAEAARKRQEERVRRREDKGEVAPGDHYVHNPENVDFKIIEDIALEQPLSHVRRPQWDMDRMIRCGFSEFRIELKGAPVPFVFLLWAKKPLGNEE